MTTLEKIRAEILNWEKDSNEDDLYQLGAMDMQNYVLQIIDKYAEQECDECKYKTFTELYFHTDHEMVEQEPITLQQIIEKERKNIKLMLMEANVNGYTQGLKDSSKAEPCDDVVSRQAIDEIKELMTDINGDTVYAVRMSDIRQLPSVRPQEPRTGHWEFFCQHWRKCSECGYPHKFAKDWNYCPNCGACMKDGRTLDEFIEDSKESEDKE